MVFGCCCRGGDRRGSGRHVLPQHHLLPVGQCGRRAVLSLPLRLYGGGHSSTTSRIIIKDTTALEKENAELRQQIAKMEAQIRQAQDDSEENAFAGPAGPADPAAGL